MATKTNNNTATTVTETEEVTTVNKKVKKKYEPEDVILCRSLISGSLNVEGPRSKFIYSWADYDDVCEVEYRDLVYLIRGKDICITAPRIVIIDDEFLEDYPEIKNQYENMYSVNDLMDIFNLTPSAMEKAIMELPTSLKTSFKGIAATMIESGRLDSVKKIKILDEIFDTNLLLTMAES